MEPGREVEIVFTGLRPGEKLRDDVLGEGEELTATSHPKVFLARAGSGCPADELLRQVAETEVALRRGTEGIAAKLHQLARLDLSATADEGRRPSQASTPTTSPN
jgi:FlaA1/EpsC-like NDP-sugar epimerase